MADVQRVIRECEDRGFMTGWNKGLEAAAQIAHRGGGASFVASSIRELKSPGNEPPEEDFPTRNDLAMVAGVALRLVRMAARSTSAMVDLSYSMGMPYEPIDGFVEELSRTLEKWDAKIAAEAPTPPKETVDG